MLADLKIPHKPDATDWQLLALLQADARLSFSELGRRVNLSTPAVAERVRKLEDAGIIRGYHAEIDASLLGRGVLAFMHFTVAKRDEMRAVDYIKTVPEVLECHHVMGNISYVLKVQTTSITALEALLRDIGRYGETMTMLVLSSPVQSRQLGA